TLVPYTTLFRSNEAEDERDGEMEQPASRPHRRHGDRDEQHEGCQYACADREEPSAPVAERAPRLGVQNGVSLGHVGSHPLPYWPLLARAHSKFRLEPGQRQPLVRVAL